MQQNVWIFVLICLLYACGKSPADPTTTAMADRLNNLYERTLTNVNYPYHNSRKADFLAEQLRGVSNKINIKIRYEYFEQLVNAGRLEEAIVKISTYLTDKKMSYAALPYYKLLAIAYLQLGEEENCVQGTSAYACVMPIDSTSIHKMTKGSEKAIEIFKEILDYRPQDKGARWLLNIAYMTLGKYPNSVPADLLIELPDTKNLALPAFKNIAASAGVNTLSHAGSCSLADFDNDGRLDVLASSYYLDEQLQFYKNLGNNKFENQTDQAGLTGITGGLNFIHADVNNDGYMDVYVMRGAWLSSYGAFPNSLLINQGDGTFSDQTEAYGLLEFYPSQTAVFADFDADGYLDLFVGYEANSGMQYASKLYRNESGKAFNDVSKSAGIDLKKYVKAVVSADVNQDGRSDLFLSIFGGKNVLLLNDSNPEKQIYFTDASEKYEVEEPLNSFPAVFFDYDNDGFTDLFVSGYYTDKAKYIIKSVAQDFIGEETERAHPKLYRNIDGKYFQDVTDSLGLAHELYTMGMNVGDLNADGYLDLFLGTGEFNLTSIMPNRVFLNEQGKKFTDITFSRKFGQLQKGHGVAFGDIDNDGDEDIYHVVGGAMQGDVFYNMLYENGGNENYTIGLKLKGNSSNHAAIGAEVFLWYQENGESKHIHRTIGTGGSFGNNSLEEIIGIGQAQVIDSIQVKWPHHSHSESRFYNMQTGRKYLIQELDHSMETLMVY